ncbi:hypothetical protein KJ966_21730 [bacterium]|nr:hypothetical protein [bacterium]
MNRYIEIGSHILDVPILLVVLFLVLSAIAILIIIIYSFRITKLSLKMVIIPVMGFALIISTFGAVYYSGVLNLEDSPIPLADINKEFFVLDTQTFSAKKQSLKFRYSISNNLKKLGFIRKIYDDGNRTYIYLNTLVIPTVYVGDSSGDLIDQKDHITIEMVPEYPFPILVADQLSTVWYLKFNSFLDHIKQNPVFEPYFENGIVKVFYSDTLYTTLKIIKDPHICNQASLQGNSTSINYSRYYFIFDNIRYYIDDCSIDYAVELQSH